MILDYFHLAVKNLRHRGIRSWLTLLGIFIGIATVVSLISLGGGLKTAINSQFGISSTEIISVQAGGLNAYGPPGSGVVSPLTMDDVEAIGRLNTVEIAIPRHVASGKMEFNEVVQFGYAMSIPMRDARKITYDTLELEVETGRLLNEQDTDKVVLGNNFFVNEEIYGKTIKPGDNVVVQEKRFEVVGIIKKKGSFIFDNIVMMNEKQLVDLFDYGDKVDIIAVKIKSKDLMDKAVDEIEKEMRKRRGVKIGEENFEVSTPQAALSTVNQVLTGIQIFLVMIAAISIIVGGVGIVNTMTTSVLERTKEIGIMKAIGAKNSDIFYLFLIESGLLGLVGGIAGIILGIGVGYFGTVMINSFLGASSSPKIDWILIAFTFLGSFIVGAVSGIIPAIRAANQKPVEALRS
ncbi:ABC transporter permease [Candidatus Pacearchaeota archaeon]|nr:ABC transporter permease [Candidatus Pacearchaeota archaeon]